MLNKKLELEMEISKYQPDIVVLTEIFPKNIDSRDIFSHELQLQGYDILMGKVELNSRGVCIQVKHGLSYQECKILNDFSFNESCWCSLKLKSGESLLIGGVYRSPSSTALNTKKLNNMINMAISLKYDYNIIVGDFNFPTISWKNWSTPNSHNHPEFLFLKCLRDNFLNQFISEPTRYREGQTSNILDLFIVDKSETVDKVTYSSNLGASDHVCFIAELSCTPWVKSTSTLKRNFHKGDYESIRNDLTLVDWQLMENMDMKESWDFLTNKLSETVSKNVPLTKTGPKKNKQKWVNRECLTSIQKKHKAWKRYIHTMDRRDYLKYCKARNECTKITHSAKKTYESSIIQNVKEDSKGFWSYVRDQTRSRTTVSDLKDTNGQMICEDKEKADLLKNFFASVFVNEPTGPLPVFDVRYHGVPVTQIKTDSEMLKKLLKNMNISKSMGPDGCHPRLFRETADIISTPLETVFDKTFNEGKVPDIWKDANVSALYKNKGDKCEPTNYRPVSLTCLPCRLCEKTVRKVIMEHMNENNLFSDCHGFRNKRSCVLQLLDVLDDWSKFYDENNQIDTVYVDIKKAFDTVPHRRLLLKLKNYGFEGEILKWIEDFLSNRRQRVIINGKSSEWKNVTSGIPQGSVLGPVLFIIYVNDMEDSLQSFCKVFADDSKIYAPVNSRADQEKLQTDLLKLSRWCRLWLMEFSVQKCKTVQYGNVKYPFNYQLEDINGNLHGIASDSKEKDLGIIFESNLKFDSHITHIVNRANRLLGLIKHTFKTLNSELFLTLYKTLIRSIIDYGRSVYFPSTKKNIQLLYPPQNEVLGGYTVFSLSVIP